ncbi:folylpolyglutamate synthase/dihydrofolate synthase family protein [Mechercharimyces sp. CAU 1602]|uniref:bifunctional folylpolyglutamate synthase/dihydrofolate synthase n=1 Tax=Mechercharimyces sp. CAU 1602 TaxID=2973933 RepID=UPI0021633BE7|nr:folylpolyglutamate synthase/dihydrofolate synthase family protein [Mechercharimyces sp. CAU 1602]MCS1351450.1 bifunctional folylpolyglutamate synthase/dihydrofolate synthase [Mechercharimyces sp. CAU 1602]
MSEQQRFHSADEVLTWMDSYCAKKIQPGLERMQSVLTQLDHPERRLKCIHIAGTNGKGSTAAMIASSLQHAGYPVGLFTSPYIQHWSERIVVDGEPIADASLVNWANHLYPYVIQLEKETGERVSPFEWWTLIAICYFVYEASPWFVVWETGMGGRLDSTNVVYPLVSVIPHIGIDHTQFLGSSLTEIAHEKAGIIKRGVPTVIGEMDEEALVEIAHVAQAQKSRLYQWDKEYTMTGQGDQYDFVSPFRTIAGVKIPLLGEHQVRNAATALMTLEVLRQFYATVLEEDEVRVGLEKTSWPGRCEVISSQPPILLDGAHNETGARALAHTIHKHFPNRRIAMLIAMMKEKEVEAILQPILPFVEKVVVTQVDDVRALPPSVLKDKITSLAPELMVTVAGNAEEGMAELRTSGTPEELILVTGSLYLVAEVRRMIQ